MHDERERNKLKLCNRSDQLELLNTILQCDEAKLETEEGADFEDDLDQRELEN